MQFWKAVRDALRHLRRAGAGFKGGYWYGLRIGRYSFGFEHSLIWRTETLKYLERWIIYVGAFTLRLHKFWSGDDDRAPHDHPFWFVTFPLHSYWERVYDEAQDWPGGRMRLVTAWLPHFRNKNFKHIVVGAHAPNPMGIPLVAYRKPFYTLVLSKFIQPNWGFWPEPGRFVHFTDWSTLNATTDRL